jgi:KaiC/GvpD/RAD55 family RecA-like ATPase
VSIMRRTTGRHGGLILVFWVFLFFAICSVTLPPVFSQMEGTSPTTFYLHSAYLGSAAERIISTDPPYGIGRWTYVVETTSFVLYPPLGRLVRIGGAVSFQLWLRAATPVMGIVNATLVEVTAERKMRYVCGIEAPVLVESVLKDQPYSFLVGPVIRAIGSDSTLVLQIVVKGVDVPVLLYWDDNRTPSQIVISFVERYYHVMSLTVRDSSNNEMRSANVTITQNKMKVWTGTTNEKGAIEATLPSTEDTSLYDVRVYWKGVPVNETRNVGLTADRDLTISCEVHDLTIIVQDFFGIPLPQTRVDLISEGQPVASNRTQSDGRVVFRQIVKGNYTLAFSYEPFQYVQRDVIVSGPTRYFARSQMLPTWFYYVMVAFAGVAAASALLFPNLRRKTMRVPFDALNDLFGGEASAPVAVMVIGSPGSGKTVLMQKIMYDRLTRGKKCVYITNNDFPSRIVEDMKQLGLDVSKFEGRIAFIDCYSGTAGKPSPQKYNVPVLTDLTNLGTQISSAANDLGPETTFFLDSLAPLFTSLRPDPIMTFIHAVGARVKGQGGSLYFSVGTGLDKDVLSRLEGLSDCIIELETIEKKGTSFKRLRIKKIRGRKHPRRWIEFSIEAPDGIVFRGDHEQFLSRRSS